MAKREKKGLSKVLYGEEEEIWEEESQQEQPKKKLPAYFGYIYRVIIILLVAALALFVFINRNNLSPENITGWLQTHVIGHNVGDGFPVSIVGTAVENGNFYQADDFAAVLSDTALSVYNEQGATLLSRQHGYKTPRLCSSTGRYLVYDLGAEGYRIENASQTLQKGSAEGKILSAAIASSGQYALLTQNSDFSCKYTAYLSDGSVQYRYSLYSAYMTAGALAPGAGMGAFTAVTSDNGTPVSKIYILSFSSQEPVQILSSTDNVLYALFWAQDGSLYALGNNAIVRVNTADYSTQEYALDTGTVTAYAGSGSAFCVALSVAGSQQSTVWCFHSDNVAFTLNCPEKAVDVAVCGNTLSVLGKAKLYSFDSFTGAALSTAAVSGDARALCLCSESTAFLLGVNRVYLQSLKAEVQ